MKIEKIFPDRFSFFNKGEAIDDALCFLFFFFETTMTTIDTDFLYAASNNREGSQIPPSNTSTLRDFPKAKTPSVPDLTRPSRAPMMTSSSILPPPSQPLPNEDIRLCTIHRADASDTFGIELNYHRKEQFHSLSITSGRDNELSSKTIRISFHRLLFHFV